MLYIPGVRSQHIQQSWSTQRDYQNLQGKHHFSQPWFWFIYLVVQQYFLAVFVSFQLAALLLISAVCLWLDQMVNRDNAISGLTYHKTLYVALSIFTLAVRYASLGLPNV